MNLTGLEARCPQSWLLLGLQGRISCPPFPLLEAPALLHPREQPLPVSVVSPQLCFCCHSACCCSRPPSCRAPCDYIGPMWVIQDHLPVSRSVITSAKPPSCIREHSHRLWTRARMSLGATSQLTILPLIRSGMSASVPRLLRLLFKVSFES